MKFYQLLKINKKIKSRSLKILGILTANFLGLRHLSVRIDPVLGCNLACQMCYFSSPEKRKELKGILSEEEIESVAKVLFPKAFQVFIGCGAEPTLSKHYIKLAQLARKYKVPDIGMVTNGQLMSFDEIKQLVEIGIDEIAFSMHGVSKEKYEEFMVNANYDKFIERLEWLEEIKRQNDSELPHLRINYTVNSENLSDLHNFFLVLGRYTISTLQIRPVVDIGGEFSKTITKEQKPLYAKLIEEFKIISKQKGIRLLANTNDIEFQNKNNNADISNAVYCYISPKTIKEMGLNWKNITFNQFMRKRKWRSTTLKSIIYPINSSANTKNKYDVY